MKKSIEVALYFAGGVATGAALAYMVLHDHFSKKFEEDIADIRRSYESKERKLDKIKEILNSTKNKEEEKRATHTVAIEKTDYNAMYNGNSEVNADYVLNETEKGKGSIYIIDIDQYGSEPDYNAESIIYYKEDSVLFDPVYGTVMDPIERFGIDILREIENCKESAIYIRDESIRTDFEIEITDESFSDSVV